MLETRKVLTAVIGYILGILMGLYCKISIVLFYILIFLIYLIIGNKSKKDKYENIENKERTDNMKQLICTILGVISSVIASFFGGWDAGLTTLLIFMGLDYISGLVVAGVFKNSPKTATGALESKAGWKGLCRKGMTLVFVLIAYRLDLVIGTDYIRNAVIIAFIANETISLVENAGLMGVPLPDTINKAIDILQKRVGGEG